MNNREIIEACRLLQRVAHSQLLEADTTSPLIGRIYKAAQELADALEELEKNTKAPT